MPDNAPLTSSDIFDTIIILAVMAFLGEHGRNRELRLFLCQEIQVIYRFMNGQFMI